MSKPVKITAISLLNIMIFLLLLYIFLPLKPRLSLLGYRLDDGSYGFAASESTYRFDIESGEIAGITTEDAPWIDDDDVDTRFRFYSDTGYLATITVTTNNETGTCHYITGHDGDIICDNITISETLQTTLKNQVESHLARIIQNFRWKRIPRYQR